MKNKKSNYTLLIIISIILLSIVGIMYYDEKEKIIINKEESKYLLLSDYSKFYTIDSCVNKYVDLLSMLESVVLLNIFYNL